MKFRILLAFLHLVLLTVACRNEHPDLRELVKHGSKPQKETTPIQENTPAYSDSVIAQMVKDAMPLPPLDTVSLLATFDCNPIRLYTFDPLENYTTSCAISDDHRRLFSILSVLGYLDALDDRRIYVVQSDNLESHRSATIDLLIIGKKTAYKVPLAYHYANEQQEHKRTAKVMQDSILIQTDYQYRFIHGIGEVDSTYTEVRRFSVEDYIDPSVKTWE